MSIISAPYFTVHTSLVVGTTLDVGTDFSLGDESASLAWDDATKTLTLGGAARVSGFSALTRRYELRWVAGQRGKPGVNGDIQSATESVRMIADPDFELLGTNAVSGSSAFNVEGGITLTTAGADNDEVILVPHLDASQSAWAQVTWGTDKEVIWECHFSTGADIDDCIIWAGLKLTNTEVKATDDDQVYFRYEDDVDANWEVVNSIADTDVSTDTGVVVAVSTEYHFKIIIDSSRVAKCFINGVLVHTTAALTDEIDLIPYVGVAADGDAAAKEIVPHSQAISRVIG